jgi:hypothetical protein
VPGVRDLQGVGCHAGWVLASTTEAVAAWSTFAAVLVALGVSLIPVWWRWYKRPRLEWSVSRNEPHRLAEWGQGLILGADYRIQVGDKAGQRQAENVRAQLRTVWLNKPNEKSKPWGNLEVDITPLRWASRRDEVASAQQVTVTPGGMDFVTYAHWDRQRHNLVIPHARQQDTTAMQGFGPGSFVFHVVMTADGVEPVVAYIEVSTDPDAMRVVKRSKAPDPEEVYSYGIYTLLDPET